MCRHIFLTWQDDAYSENNMTAYSSSAFLVPGYCTNSVHEYHSTRFQPGPRTVGERFQSQCTQNANASLNFESST